MTASVESIQQSSSNKKGPRFRISDLCNYLETYLNHDQIREIYRAYLFGAAAHEGQRRKSGEAYIFHPLAVAKILADMHMDQKSIMAAILHDVIEDTITARDDLKQEFGEEVAILVDGVSKLTHINTKTKAEAQAENFRKMLLAMVRDIRVIIIKLADRLHNMRTLGSMPLHKRRRIAKETLEIYAPIANRLGMNHIRHELEDLGFAHRYPMRYRILSSAMTDANGRRKGFIKKIEKAIKRRLHQENYSAKVLGREKHVFSIYRKMLEKTLNFKEVFDVYAFRIIVSDADICYRVLGIIHGLFRPLPGRFKDYIAIPKANGYQSLHTNLVGPHGVNIEVQIRSKDMHRIAEAGIASHWLYKTGSAGKAGKATHNVAHDWLRNILAVQEKSGSSLEFIENVKIDLFPDEVYVFTPAGKIMVLPKGATIVDFAYTVHTDVGHSCVAGRIDRRLAPLRTRLLNGQMVEVITAKGAQPNPAWLNFVLTAKARSNIRAYLRNFKTQEATRLGRRLLEKALTPYALSIADLPTLHMKNVLVEFDIAQLDDLLQEIGLGNRMAPLVARRLVPTSKIPNDGSKLEDDSNALSIKGTEGMLVNLARCCRPIPGDAILGFFSSGRGIVVHNQSCKNTISFRKRPESWIDVQWEEKTGGEFCTEIHIEVANRRGVLAMVAASVSETDSNIENVSIEEHDGLTSTITLTLLVRDRTHVAKIIKRIRKIKTVMRIYRTKG